MDLGAFSVSLSVKDLAASRAFYERLGFTMLGGDPAQGWIILRGPTATIGLFQGMFDGNILTFTPGWDDRAQPLAAFTDIRDIQARLEAGGLSPTRRADPDGRGPDHLTLSDPDGNTILIDQHRPAP